MGRYRVRIGDREWTVDVEGERARNGDTDTAVSLRPSALPGEVEIVAGDARLRVVPQPRGADGSVTVLFGGRFLSAEVVSERDRLGSLFRPGGTARSSVEVRSEIPGIIREVRRRPGDRVEAGEPLLTLEAMKMENVLRAGSAGRVVAVNVEPGQRVMAGEVLAVVESQEPGSR